MTSALCAILAAVLVSLSASAGAYAAAPRGEPPPAQRMVDAAIVGDAAGFERALAQVQAQPKPARGERRLARDLNERGLAQWQRGRFAEAAAIFSQAHAADAGDAEIAENLGYALLRSDQLDKAQAALMTALALDPGRASAWGSLGQVFAKQGKHREGLACMVTAYRFSRDKSRTLDVYARLARVDDDPRVRALLNEALARISRGT
jgi:Flp pilus assembly protein TadD